jgi:hypothetical protein
MTYQYSQLMSGYATDGILTRIGSDSRGFNGKRLIGYPESHDKERLMYNAMTYGNAGGTAPPLNNLNNALARMSAIGAASILVPGPKMLWHFADLGMQNSIWTCNNGTVNTDIDPFAGDCKLDTKPQPQWTNNWLAVAQRNKIYNDWARLISLKINEPVFEASHAFSTDGSNVKQRIYIFDNSIPTTSLRNVVVLCNFSVANLPMIPSFPYTGTWYNLMDNTQITVTDVNATISIPSGQFLIYGNRPATTLANENFIIENDLFLSPNPANNSFSINANAAKIQIYSVTGQLVKQFNGSFDNNYNYNIEDLTNGIYLVKVMDIYNNEKSLRLIKQ